MHAIFVTINIKDGHRDEFMAASLGDSQGSVRDEPGCLRFDILEDKTNANRFYLYEVYENEGAHMTAHRNAPHYLKWRETVSPWFDGDISAVPMNTIFPSDGGWKAQKPGLLNW